MKTPSAKILAKKADDYEQIRKERLALQKQVDELKAKEKLLENYLLKTLEEAEGLTTIGGATVIVSIKDDEIPIIEDREAFRKYINKTKYFHLAQALKPAAAAVKEIWENGGSVPGVTPMKISKLSRKAK